ASLPKPNVASTSAIQVLRRMASCASRQQRQGFAQIGGLAMRVFFFSLFFISGTVSGCGRKAPEPAAPKPPEVLFVLPTSREITDYEDFTGRTEAAAAVEG